MREGGACGSILDTTRLTIVRQALPKGAVALLLSTFAFRVRRSDSTFCCRRREHDEGRHARGSAAVTSVISHSRQANSALLRL